ncbi:UvrD-helicase domain-containing protein [Morganella morganii]|nr:ATP-dependent helicase [Morganella morganii]HCR3200723.1 ATP-dependent helicase [Morganella morganii]HCT8190461.1 ATP-dependent helicase [Morganella morganii]
MSNNLDDGVEIEIKNCLDLYNLKSFFLFAGAGAGKTRSLVNALNYIKKQYRSTLLSQGKYVGVITYTKAARDEIIHRTDTDSIFHIATIHGFCWSIIQGFNQDIRDYLSAELENRALELNKKIGSARNIKTQTYQDNINKLERTNQRLHELNSIYEFTYNPNTTAQFGKDSLSHDEVIDITIYLLKNKSTFQTIVISKYPYILIDESQDTYKELVEVLLTLESRFQGQFLLGLIGDEMQRIYLHGKQSLSSCIGKNWHTPKKLINHRSQKRIIDLANLIRQDSDKIKQQPRNDKQGGYVHLFIICKNSTVQSNDENQALKRMAEISNDNLWLQSDSVKKLYLEHRMAAIQQGFIELYDLFYGSKEYKKSISEGSIPELSFFSKLINPLIQALVCNDQFRIMEIIRNSSSILKGIESPITTFHNVSMKVLSNTAKSVKKLRLYNYLNRNKPYSFLAIAIIIKKEKLFNLPPKLDAALSSYTCGASGSHSQDSESVWERFLKLPYKQLGYYINYINGDSAYETHHGVKGREFDRVMVVMNDYEKKGRGGLSASYEKLFGVVDESDTDKKNTKEGKETDLQRTRRLFYVTSTRAKESLALVVYTDNPDKLKENVLAKKWFIENEISIIQ